MSLRKWLTAIIVLPLVLVVCLTASLLVLAHATRQAESDAEHVSELYSEVSELATSLLRAASQARAYTIKHNVSDLDAYLGTRQTVQFQFARLREESPPKTGVSGQIAELDGLAGNVLSTLDAVVAGGQTARLSDAANTLDRFSVVQKRFADIAYEIRARRLAGLTRLWNMSLAVLVFAAVCGLIVTVGLAFVARRHLAGRIERVERRARAYTSGQELPDTPPVGGHDEIARLDDALRTMASTIAARETELRHALREAEAASHAKSAFVATISHELRTPLNGVIGMSELLMEAPLPAREHEYASTIHTSSELLLGVINDILDFSRLSAGALSLRPSELQLESLVHSVVAVFSAQARQNGVALKVDFAAGVPSTIFADDLRLRQVLANLIGNAVKFTPAGSVSVTVTSQEQGPERALVTFDVTDTGVGIAESMRETIFEAFRQADMSKTREFGGTGLGLSIVRHLVTLMGGAIALRDTTGAGSTFTVTIPFQTKPAVPQAPAPVAATAPAARTAVESRPESVLLVEDNEINQRVATRLLQRLGLQAHVAENGRAALDELERAHYDLILMDLQMPVMDGFEASAEVRRRETRSGSHIPIVALTANALPDDREACLAAGMDDHVAKPLTLAELRRVVDRWLPERPPAY